MTNIDQILKDCKDRMEKAIEQIALIYAFKNKPKAEDAFDASFLPSAAERRVH